MLLTPTEVYVKAAHLGTKKAQVLWWKTLILSILGGGYIALGGATCYLVAGTLNQAPGFPDSSQHNTGIYRLIFGAFGFPFAFTAIYTCGSELFTCQCLYTFVAWMEGQIPVVTHRDHQNTCNNVNSFVDVCFPNANSKLGWQLHWVRFYRLVISDC